MVNAPDGTATECMEIAWEFRRAHEGNGGMVLGSSGTLPIQPQGTLCQWRLFIIDHDPDVGTKWVVVYEKGTKFPQRLSEVRINGFPAERLNNEGNPLRRRRADSYRLEVFQWIFSKTHEDLADIPLHFYIDPATIPHCLLALTELDDPDVWIERYQQASRSHPAYDFWRAWCIDYYESDGFAAQHYLKQKAEFERLAENFEQVAVRARDNLNEILAVDDTLKRVDKTDRWLLLSATFCNALQEAGYHLSQQKGLYEQACMKAEEKGVLPDNENPTA